MARWSHGGTWSTASSRKRSAGHTHLEVAAPTPVSAPLITDWGSFHGSNHNSEHNELVGGRTPITTEALVAYNGLRAFAGLQAVDIDAVGNWAFANGLTNNSQAWGNDIQGVGLWYAMQGAKVGWIADETYKPQILADIQRTARLGSDDDVMDMVRQFGHQGFADHIEQSGLQNAFINTLKMEPHYGGWMHGRTHGFLPIENGAIAHDINLCTCNRPELDRSRLGSKPAVLERHLRFRAYILPQVAGAGGPSVQQPLQRRDQLLSEHGGLRSTSRKQSRIQSGDP